MVAITATAPRLTPTTTHRIQPGIYGSFNACQILLLLLLLLKLLSPARGAVRFSVTSSIVSFRAISAMPLAYPAVLLRYSRDSLTLPGSGTCPFLWQSGRRLRSSEYFLQCHNCLICKLKVAPEQCFDRASQHRQSKWLIFSNYMVTLTIWGSL